jgi:hypothetical protein
LSKSKLKLISLALRISDANVRMRLMMFSNESFFGLIAHTMSFTLSIIERELLPIFSSSVEVCGENLSLRSVNSLYDLGLDAANSRLYAGIHYQPTIDAGITQGEIIANNILSSLTLKK